MFTFYKIVISLSFPYIWLLMLWRIMKGKEDRGRFGERKGRPGRERPESDIFWMHGASVGETVSMLPLIDKILEEYPLAHVMVTSCTVTSATLMEKRLPKRAFHQYIPIDLPFYTKRFLKYWKPRAVLWFESEFWPSILNDIKDEGIPLLLINGRISDKSFQDWKKYPRFIRTILQSFTLAMGQSPNDEERLRALGAPNVACEGNIKFAAQPLPYDKEEEETLQNAIGKRKFFLVSSTHHNEEERFVPIYKNLKECFPDLLMIISPRHPSRGPQIEQSLQKEGLKTARRTLKQPLTPQTDIYIADTLGEMGLFYKLSSIVFIGGSLIAHGGQNFIEPLHFQDAVLVGPNMHNFRLPMKLAQEENAVIQAKDEKDLQEKLSRLLGDDTALSNQKENSRRFTKNLNRVLENTFNRIKDII